jgi:hypothetical protein
LCVLFIAVTGLAFVVNAVSWPSWIFLLVVVWPIYRLYELALFVFGWIFVHTNPIYSIPRSLFTFLLNLFEIAILTTTLEVALAGLPTTDRWGGVCASCTAPGFSDTRQRYAASCAVIVAAIQRRLVSAGLR